MNTKHTPLLSDRQLKGIVDDAMLSGCDDLTVVAVEVRSRYEAELSKDRELMQKLVDVLGQKGESLGASHPHLSNYIAYTGGYWKEKADALKLAADRGITPTDNG